jgi:hypothetical protein
MIVSSLFAPPDDSLGKPQNILGAISIRGRLSSLPNQSWQAGKPAPHMSGLLDRFLTWFASTRCMKHPAEHFACKIEQKSGLLKLFFTGNPLSG